MTDRARGVNDDRALAERVILGLQASVLENMALGAPLDATLVSLCELVDAAVPGACTSVMRLDRDANQLYVLAAPQIPPQGCQVLDGLIPSENAASCGTAAYTGQPVIVGDTLTDARWAPYRDIANELGIRACWSFPVFDRERSVIATFAISSREPGLPDDAQRILLGTAAHLAQLAFEREHHDEAMRRAESAMRQAQKRESLGVLAGGIAHDFNNLLTGIVGNAELAIADMKSADPARPLVERIRTAARRSSELCKQMMSYAGQTSLSNAPLDLSELVTEVTSLVGPGILGDATLRLDLAEKLPTMVGDATQLTQVTLNLLTNAAEATERQPDATVTVRTGVVEDVAWEFERAIGASDLARNECIFVEVRDNGIGMSDETLARMFDPFFTTKFEGRGLGLAAALGIVRCHGGAVRVTSELGRGTTVRVLLPTQELDEGPIPAIANHPAGSRSTSSAGLTALVADDERMVRDVAKQSLEREGWNVLTADNGDTASAIVRDTSRRIDVVVLDVTMPGVPSVQVVDLLAARRPDVPVLLCSGHGEGVVRVRFGDREIAGFLRKPFTPHELVAQASELVAATARPRP